MRIYFTLNLLINPTRVITRNKSTKNHPIVLPKKSTITISSDEKINLMTLDNLMFNVFNIGVKPVELSHYNLFEVIHLFTKSVPYLQISQETFNRIFKQLNRLGQIFLLFSSYMSITQGPLVGTTQIRENPKFNAVFNATISNVLFNQESQLTNYISLQTKYIHKEIFSILSKQSRLLLNDTADDEISNFLTIKDIEILQRMCIPIRDIDFITENEKKKPKINANYLLNHLILNFKEHQGVYYSFIKAYDTLYNGNLYVQVTNYLKTLSIFFRMYIVLAKLPETFACIYDSPELNENEKGQMILIRALPPLQKLWNPLEQNSVYITLNATESKPSKSCGKQILILLEEIISCYRTDLNYKIVQTDEKKK